MEEEKIEEKEEIEDIQEHEALIPDTEPYNPSDQQTTGKIFVPSPDNVRPKDAIPPKEATISGEAQFSSQSLFSVRNQRK